MQKCVASVVESLLYTGANAEGASYPIDAFTVGLPRRSNIQFN